MARGQKFASGKYAWGMCDICGVRCPYREMRGTTVHGVSTGLRVCPVCWDPDHPQNFLDRAVTADAQALRDARPDTGLTASRVLYPPANWGRDGRPLNFRGDPRREPSYPDPNYVMDPRDQ